MGTTINAQNYAPGQPPAGISAANPLWQAYQQSVGLPTQAAAQGQIGDLNQQLQLLMSGKAQQTTGINQGLQNSLARLGISGQQQGIQQGALTRAEKLLPQEHQLNLADLLQQTQQAWQGAQQQQRGLSSSAIAGGSLQSIGTNQGMQNIKTQLGQSLATIGRNTQRENLSYKDQLAQFKDDQSNLNLASKSLGIDKTELMQKTQQALQQLGLQTSLSAEDIMKGISQAQLGEYTALGPYLPMILQAAGISAGGGAQAPASKAPAAKPPAYNERGSATTGGFGGFH